MPERKPSASVWGRVCPCLSVLLVAVLLGCSGPKAAPTLPLYAQDQYIAGMLALRQLHFEDAETAARAAMKEAPDFLPVQTLLAESLFKQDREADALAALDAITAKDAAYPVPYLLRGMSVERGGDLPAAQTLYQRARDSYDTLLAAKAKPAKDAVSEYVTASYLASGKLAGFKALDRAQEWYPDDEDLLQMRSFISQDRRELFLDRVKPQKSAPKENK